MLRYLTHHLPVALFVTLSLVDLSSAGTPKDTLVVARQLDEMITLDPAEAYEVPAMEVLANTYDRIMRFEPTDLTKVVGGVAESVTVSQDGKTFTFKIRSGMKFASGNPVTAQDAAYSLRRVVKLGKTPVFLLTQLGLAPENVDQMVTAPDDATLKLTIGPEFAPTLVYALLSSGVGSVVDSKVVMDHEKAGDFGHEWLKDHSAGGGAFILKSWKPNESVIIEANPNYRGGMPGIKRVVTRHVPEPVAQRLLLEKGDVDLARNLSPDQIAGLQGRKDVVTSASPQATLFYIALNLKTKEFQNPNVLKAVRYLIDYKGMTETFLKGSMEVHQNFLPTGFWAASEENPYAFDLDKAKQLLTDAGYASGFTIDFDVPNTLPYTSIAQSVQATMAQAGITVNIKAMETKALITRFRARTQSPMLIYNWAPDNLDPHSNAEAFANNSDNSDNAASKLPAWRVSWFDEEATGLTQSALRERDEAKREKDYKDLQEILLNDSPFVFLFQSASQYGYRSNVNNFIIGPIPDLVYYNLMTK